MMRVPAIVVCHHGNRDITDFCFARQLRLLQVGHANHIHAQPAIHIRFRPSGKLGPFHTEISSTMSAGHANLLARSLDHSHQLPAYRISKSDVRHDSSAEKSIDAIARAVEELIRNYKIQRLVLFLQ